MAGSFVGGLTFGMPPSLGREPVRVLARRFADVLYGIGFTTIIPPRTYEEMEEGLLSGELHAAWAPPIVCARVESGGGSVLLRAVRNGGVTYRAVLLCRSTHVVDFKRLGEPGGPQLRAVWVDSRSMGGCILARHYLRSRGVTIEEALSEERMLGSYQNCFDAVLDCKADLTSSFAGRRGLGFVELCGDRARELRQIAYTEESPNDGVVVSPHLDEALASDVANRIRTLFSEKGPLEILSTLFNVNGFDEPPTGTYAALLSML